MEMAGRGFSGSYRFGYQGSEKDNEVSGDEIRDGGHSRQLKQDFIMFIGVL